MLTTTREVARQARKFQLPWQLAEAVRAVWQTGNAVASFVSW
jgi:hypothetical protein